MELYYEEFGTGFPLIFLHGNGGSHACFHRQIAYFRRKFRVIVIDTRGHGRSPRGTGDFSISRFADDLYEFFQNHNIEKANLFGFSDGGNIALLFAMRHPEKLQTLRVPTLVLAGTHDIVKTKHSRLIANSLPPAKSALVPGNHSLIRFHAGKVNRLTDCFLQKRTRKQKIFQNSKKTLAFLQALLYND